MRLLYSLTVLLVAGSAVYGQTVDGTIAGDPYGPAVSVQAVQTQFGDNFSELNAAYATVSGGKLYLAITGNLEGNFNKLNIFIDSVAGGQNMIDGAMNPPNDGWAGKHNGMMFDTGFDADYLFILRNGNFGGNRFDLDYAVVGGGATSFDNYSNVFSGSLTGAATTAAGPNLGFSFDVGFNNSNVAGVTGGTGPANMMDALAVQTGIELGIPLAAIGNPTGVIQISAMVNGSNHDYLSNQFLGPLTPPQGNLGADGSGGGGSNLSLINLKNFQGDQYFRFVVPEPAGVLTLLLGLAALAGMRGRR